MKKLLFIIILLGVIAGGAYVTNNMGYLAYLSNFTKKSEIKIDKTANVVTEIKKISKFTTAYYYEEQLQTGKKHRIIVDDDECDLIVKGKVRAGYDLESLSDSTITIKGDTLQIKLPEVQIFEATVNPSNVDVFVEKGKWSHEEYTYMIQLAQKKLIKDAKKAGILTKAEKAGKTLLTNLFKSFGFKEVVLE